MATADRVATLRTKHSQLEMTLERENQRPAPREMLMKQLKLEKLRQKDEMTRLQA